MTLDIQPLPLKRCASCGVLWGWMNKVTFSSWAFANTGWYLGSEKSCPKTLPPMAAPRRPKFLTAFSSCSTASAGSCIVSEANAANLSGRMAQSSARCMLFNLQISAAVSLSLRYQNGLILSTCISMPCASIALIRSLILMKCSGTPLVGGGTDLASSPIKSIASWNMQCACTSIVLIRFPLMKMGVNRFGWASLASAAWESPHPQKNNPPSALLDVFRNDLRRFI